MMVTAGFTRLSECIADWNIVPAMELFIAKYKASERNSWTDAEARSVLPARVHGLLDRSSFA